MGKIKLLIIFFLIMLTVYGCASAASKIKVIGVNDPLEEKVKVSTFEYERPLIGEVKINKGQYHFIGYVDKNTGSKSYQLYTVIPSRESAGWDMVRFAINGKLTKIQASRVNIETRCNGFGVSCIEIEDMVVMLDRETLDHWANSITPMRVRYSSSYKPGEVDIMINPKEVSAFLERMDKGK